MFRLLRAGIRRYLHSVVFWLAVIAIVSIALDAGMRARERAVDDFCVLLFFVVSAVVTVSFIGRESAEGGFRNKVIIGHTKGSIFLSELILSIVCNLLLAIIFFSVFFIINNYIFARFPVDLIITMLIDCLLSGICFTAILASVCCLISNRIASAMISILLVFAMVLGTNEIEHALLQPEYFESYSSTLEEWTDEEGNVHHEHVKDEESVQKTDNPAYISEPLRTVYKVVYNISPSGHISQHIVFTYDWFGYDYRDSDAEQSWEDRTNQIVASEISEEDYKNVAINLFYCTAFLISISLIGYLIFRKKELK